MKQKTVLITGATGFIGSHLAKKLVEKGEKIRCLVRTSSPKIAVDYLNKLDVELVYGDLLDYESLRKAVDGVDTIFHLGGGGRVGMSKAICNKINVNGTGNILEACIESGKVKRFVHLSSCAVMGHVSGGAVDETYPYNPNNIEYSRAKTKSEKLVLSYSNKIDIVVVRFPGVYGIPLIKGDADYIQGVTPALMIFSAVKKGEWMYVGNGKNQVHMFYVDDAVKGLILATDKGKSGDIYIIGDNTSVKMTELVDTVADILKVPAPKKHIPVFVARFFAALFELKASVFGGTPKMSGEMVTGFISNMSFSIAKAKRDLEYEPKVGLEEGMRKTIEWYEKNEYV
ncbi:MAG: NAD-dependent epimerase/dehydratase family protein [ANME-2 cluster archaeon]|nr:NAD-dependent epimerase/dehydratase family protein [ANME-2 cluster archaeon]MBC2702000.1 NAD-dependent epimerase/dehydratase family protein [ANME-2 cluster archaeon]MBC2706678.1 NAD-dependent epimerase/dehydratase family protein [ANME-2 cluster archaeon]MBC2748706.1 NAD-dependent epimerase/dehydratase family protein [ANME-2 cluster archaeon]MBC2763072.1 NAD-dependent epimerase/dehydratase family protein [ANME-2 cluster archaeon]